MESAIGNCRYVLAVKDLTASAEFYEKKLGFKTGWSGGGWYFLHRDKFMVMLGECPDDRSAHETRNHSYFAYADVTGIDQLHEEFTANAVEILSAPEDKPWGQREFAIRTIDGHRITFGEEIPGAHQPAG
ncbi:MAG: glyoxalase [Bacteroidia bacterium]|nr:glyoxalase [Bacteroidia bacterium]